jgi:hypothetical protein
MHDFRKNFETGFGCYASQNARKAKKKLYRRVIEKSASKEKNPLVVARKKKFTIYIFIHIQIYWSFTKKRETLILMWMQQQGSHWNSVLTLTGP